MESLQEKVFPVPGAEEHEQHAHMEGREVPDNCEQWEHWDRCIDKDADGEDIFISEEASCDSEIREVLHASELMGLYRDLYGLIVEVDHLVSDYGLSQVGFIDCAMGAESDYEKIGVIIEALEAMREVIIYEESLAEDEQCVQYGSSNGGLYASIDSEIFHDRENSRHRAKCKHGVINRIKGLLGIKRKYRQ